MKSDSNHKYSANKKFGQHFLISDHIIKKICDDFQSTSSELNYCLEIGPGPGVLTKTLVKNDLPLKVIEIDNRFIPDLNQLIGSPNVTNQDALDIDLNTFFEESEWSKNIWLVSNLPYNVAAPLMIRFYPLQKIQRMTLMMQKEMADRILPPNSKKRSNPLAIYASSYFKVTELIQVPPESFSPPPKVDSTVLSFERLDQPKVPFEDYDQLLKFGRGIFSMARKQLFKVAKTNLSGVNWEEILEKTNIPKTIRAEALSHDQVLELFFAWKQGIK